MKTQKRNIRTLALSELTDFFKTIEEKPFRAKQVYEWLWKKGARSFEDMSNISKEIRTALSEKYTFPSAQINVVQKSADGTIKIAFKLYDGNEVEGVLIPSKERVTACISSQVGCPLSCAFCATGLLGFTRNMNFDEIVDQVTILTKQSQEHFGQILSNIVFMGMGEPLLNYPHVIKAIDKITSVDGLGISPQRITISTAGIVKGIRQMGDDKVKCNLAVSLHTANDKKRNMIMAVNKQNPIKELIEALRYYHSKTKNRITIEYVLLKDFNDGIADARELAVFCKNFPVKVNIIEYNAVQGTIFKKTDAKKMNAFVAVLKERNMVVNIRNSRGQDIAAACGQLANKIK